jgi:hypothetical protein
MQLPRTLALLLLLAFAGSCQMFGEPGENSEADTADHDPEAQPPGGRPTGADVVHGVVSNSVGPYSIFMALATAGIHQATDNPPEWRQGFPALSERFGSNIGITTIGNSVRYGVGWAMNADFHSEKCACSGTVARLRHAVKNTAMARSRKNGSAVLSLPNLIAPYVATTSAVYAWYPARYGMKDAFRMGNYNLLGTLSTNIVFEFMPVKAINFLHWIHFGGFGGSQVPARTNHP